MQKEMIFLQSHFNSDNLKCPKNSKQVTVLSAPSIKCFAQETHHKIAGYMFCSILKAPWQFDSRQLDSTARQLDSRQFDSKVEPTIRQWAKIFLKMNKKLFCTILCVCKLLVITMKKINSYLQLMFLEFVCWQFDCEFEFYQSLELGN